MIIRSWALFLAKYKALLEAAGHAIYARYDDAAQNLICLSKLFGLINLDGNKNVGLTFQMIKDIIETVALDNQNENIEREVTQLSHIFQCKRNSNKPLVQLINVFSRAVLEYVNETGLIKESISRQLAVMMIKHASLTFDTLITVTFQIDTTHHIRLGRTTL